MTSLTYRPDLDGLRAIAVYLVLLFHAGMVTVGGGFIGVDLFFVLSGFLVTGVLLREMDQRGTFALGNFYARRVRRLLPAAVVVVVATAAFQLLVGSLPARMELVDDARASLLYFANWHFILESRDYFGAELGENTSPFLHFWSLAIEEQFYVFYPLLLLLLLRVSGRPVRTLFMVLVALLVVSVGLQVWRAASDVDYAYYATETRLYQLVAGALLALGVRAATRDVARRLAPAAAWGGAVGLVALLLVASRWVEVSPSNRGLLATAAGVLLIAGLWFAPQGRLARLLGLPLPRFLGQISYGTYLWHWPVLLVVLQLFDVRPLVAAAVGAVVATALAALSFTVLERPIRHSPRLSSRRWSVALGGVGVSALVALLVVPPVLETDRRPAVAAAHASATAPASAALDKPVPRGLDLVAAKEDVGPRTTMCTPEELDACIRVRGDGAHVMLLGDSQARMYVSAMEELARRHDLTFSTNVVAGCPWQLGQVNLRADEAGQAACNDARERFFADVLPQLDVDVVLAIGLSRSDPYWESRLSGRASPDGESLAQLQVRTTRETVETIRAAGPEVVIASSMIGTGGFGLEGFDPIECLAAASRLADCAVHPPLDRPAVDHAYGVLATEMAGVHVVDFNPVICPNHPVCSPVIGRTVVWKDPDHVTSEVLTRQAPELWRRLAATGTVG